MPKDKKLWLSPSGLSLLDRCPRCFWLQYKKGIRQPEGIVSRLANRFDGVIKKYFDVYRKQGILPPMIEGQLEGKLENPFNETYFYHHSDNKHGYWGKLDECLITKEGKYSPVDHKTSSSDPRKKEPMPAYQHQLDSYAWLLDVNKKPSSGEGHLIFFYPDDNESLHDGFKMIVHIVTLKTDPADARDRFLNGLRVLEEPIPSPSQDCPFCLWREQVNKEIS